jgi:uncharacterized protein
VEAARLRKEREVAFYGDADFIPTEEYGLDDGKQAIRDAEFTFSVAASVIG